MDAKIKAKWVEALRSGKFKQGQRAMHNATENTQCRLGVLCAVQNPESLRLMGLYQGYSNITPPDHLRAGLNDEDLNTLMAANDTYGWSFEDIAAYVEAML